MRCVRHLCLGQLFFSTRLHLYFIEKRLKRRRATLCEDNVSFATAMLSVLLLSGNELLSLQNKTGRNKSAAVQFVKKDWGTFRLR